MLLLGGESSGVSDEVHAAADARLRVPMRPEARSLNVVVGAAMVLGEALRQTGEMPEAVRESKARNAHSPARLSSEPWSETASEDGLREVQAAEADGNGGATHDRQRRIHLRFWRWTFPLVGYILRPLVSMPCR